MTVLIQTTLERSNLKSPAIHLQQQPDDHSHKPHPQTHSAIHYTPQAPNGTVSIGLTNYLGESNNRTDVAAFLQQYRPDAVGAATTFTETDIDNPTDVGILVNNSTASLSFGDTEITNGATRGGSRAWPPASATSTS